MDAGRAAGSLFRDVDLEARIGKDRRRRTIRGVVNEALGSFRWGSRRYTPAWVIPPSHARSFCERGCYRPSIRSERRLMGQPEFDLRFRWFVGICIRERARRSCSGQRRIVLERICYDDPRRRE
jgi:hypothetical protein